MKKLLLATIFFLAIGAATAQRNPAVPTTTDNPGVTVPNNISTRFNTDRPNMHPTWQMENKNYRAFYTEGTLARSVTYDMNGNMLTWDEELAGGSYPPAITDYFSKNYPGETYSVWARAGNSYYTTRNGETLWFDKNGKYKRKVKAQVVNRPPPTN